MSLTLQSLRIKNFGPYFGDQAIELDTPPGSPVVLIHGENTLGKTQLFAALRWCLYGTFQPQQQLGEAERALKEHFNRKAARDGDHELEVRVIFRANGETYRLTRMAVDHGNHIETTADLRVGPAVIAAADIDAEVGRLLHPQISEFFLFDAELLQRFYDRLNSDRQRTFMRETIEAVLGIPALQLAERDVGILAEDAAKRHAKAAKDRDEADRIDRRLRELSNRRKSLDRDREETTAKLRDAERERDELRQQMAAIEGLQGDVGQQELLEANLADGDREIATIQIEMKALLGKGWLAAASRPLGLALAALRSSNSVAVREQENLVKAQQQVAVLTERLKGGPCPTCHQDLPPPDPGTASELETAQEELRRLKDSSGGGTLDLDRERALRDLVDQTTPLLLKDKQNRLNEIEMLQYDRRRELSSIADRLRGHKAADIRALGQRFSRTEQAIEAARAALTKIGEHLSDSAADEQAEMRKLTRLKGTQPEVAIEASFFAFVQAAYNQTIARYRERVREEVESAANAMFLELIRDPGGYGGLRISSDYRVEVLDRYKLPRETSEGGRQLLALSLIGALKTAAVRGGPVVLDSPLGRLDLEHRAHVLQTWIPSLGNQAVLLVQSGELTVPQAHELLGSLIGREYRIERPDADPEFAVVRAGGMAG